MKALYCEFETDYKENSYFDILAAGEKNQVMRYYKHYTKIQYYNPKLYDSKRYLVSLPHICWKSWDTALHALTIAIFV